MSLLDNNSQFSYPSLETYNSLDLGLSFKFWEFNGLACVTVNFLTGVLANCILNLNFKFGKIRNLKRISPSSANSVSFVEFPANFAATKPIPAVPCGQNLMPICVVTCKMQIFLSVKIEFLYIEKSKKYLKQLMLF